MTRASRSFALIFLASITSISLFSAACSRQKEGERCVLDNGDKDCETGTSPTLYCTPSSNLRGEDQVDRCCPNREDNYSDSRCAPRTTVIGPGGAAGDGDGDSSTGGNEGDGDGDGDGDSSAGVGDACRWASECVDGLVCSTKGKCQKPAGEDEVCGATSECVSGLLCGPTGVCQVECQKDVDCPGDQECTKEHQCVDS